VADWISSTEADVPTEVATIVVTISHYRSCDANVRFEPATYRSSDEPAPSPLDAYVSPRSSEGGRVPIRRWRASLAGAASSHESLTGQEDTNLVRPGRGLGPTLGVLRRHGTAVVVAAAAAIAAAVFLLSPARSTGTEVVPTAPTPPEAESAAVSTTKPADGTYLASSGLIGGLYGGGADALTALARSGLAGESRYACASPQATTRSH
jgi:hypothetical protein